MSVRRGIAEEARS